jgi:hypothetical protein
VRELLRSFVPAADEVGRLQRQKDPECLLFQRIAEQGHFAGRTEPSDTRQGIYATTADGRLLASINTRSPRAMAGMLRQALERWETLAAEPAPVEAADTPREVWRWERLYPEDGLALRVVTRDVDREDGPDDWRAHAWNLDHAWFRREEVQALVPAQDEVGAGATWPAELVIRLVRCHLVDSVRGQVPAFEAADVERAALVSTITAVEGPRVELAITGSTRAAVRGEWHVNGFSDAPAEHRRGYEAELLGQATFDRQQGRFTAFELVAAGTRWGGTRFNGRGDDLEPAPMAVSLTLGGDTPADRVAPALVWVYGWAH